MGATISGAALPVVDDVAAAVPDGDSVPVAPPEVAVLEGLEAVAWTEMDEELRGAAAAQNCETWFCTGDLPASSGQLL